METTPVHPLTNTPKESNLLKIVSLILGALLFLYIGGVVGYYVGSANSGNIEVPPDIDVPPGRIMEKVLPPDDGGQVVCTMDAKICPDGTAVGREGPNCEFAACPD